MTTTLPSLPSGDPEDRFRLFRRQATIFITLDATILTGLFLIQIIFSAQIGVPSRWLWAAVLARLTLIGLEGLWLGRQTSPAPARLRAYSILSPLLNLLATFAISVAADTAESYYNLIMLVAIIAATVRFTLPRALAIAVAAGALIFSQLEIYFHRHGSIDSSEIVEAATTTGLYIVTAIGIWALVRQLRREQSRLRQSLQELQATRDRLVQEEKLAAVGRFATAIAHEIRNPVAMIASSLSTAASPANSPEIQAEMYSIATQEATRLERFTTDFLSYARTRPPERRQTSLRSALDYAASLAKASADAVGLRLAVDCPDDIEGPFDAFQIHQVLLNLVRNAIEAAPPRSTIRLLGQRRGDGMLLLAVENAGEAIPEEPARRIFEPFFTTKPKGTGLGLAIARNIARGHGGELVLACNAPGQVRFELTLPPTTGVSYGQSAAGR